MSVARDLGLGFFSSAGLAALGLFPSHPPTLEVQPSGFQVCPASQAPGRFLKLKKPEVSLASRPWGAISLGRGRSIFFRGFWAILMFPQVREWGR